MNGNKIIAVFGTFDVDNYGDLLFPFIIENRLKDYNLEFISPTENTTVFKDAKKVISFKNCLRKKYDGVLIGGGNILHLKPNIYTVYQKKGFSYADLWIGAIKLGAKQKIPSMFNAPGISQRFVDSIDRKIVKDALNCCNYISLREKYSKKIIQELNFDHNIIVNIVPDTAFEISKLWPLKKDSENNVITINLNKRYHHPIEETAKWIDEIAKQTKCRIKFLIIGDCHGDLNFTQQVAGKLNSDNEIDISDNLKSIAHSIGNSKMFIGSSMHGFITALSFKTPAFLVLNNEPMHKFKGLYELCGLSHYSMCTSFYDCFIKIESPALLTEDAEKQINIILDTHWNHIISIIESDGITKSSKNVRNYSLLLSKKYKSNTIKVFYRKLKTKFKL